MATEAIKNITDEKIDSLKQWILDKNPEAGDIGLDTDIIGQGVLDSLEMVSFLIYIEELRAKEIPEELIKPEYFVSLRTIYETFFSEE